jgi:hypothetical protein
MPRPWVVPSGVALLIGIEPLHSAHQEVFWRSSRECQGRADQHLTNPSTFFMFVFLPQFISPDRDSVAAQLLVLG